jgi:hypothetical protein
MFLPDMSGLAGLLKDALSHGEGTLPERVRLLTEKRTGAKSFADSARRVRMTTGPKEL